MSRIDVPIVDEGEPDLPAVHEALEDPQKRWLVAGICIHSVISPLLREFVKPVFEGIYTALVRNESINKQAYKSNVTHYPMSGGKKLNYECINNNMAIDGPDRTKRFDYAVHSAVDLSKLFLQTHMCFHTGFDDSCDSSALMTFLINVDDFKSVRSDARRFRDKIRNDWAHCDFTVWTEQKLADSFDLMKDLIKSLQLPSDDETNVLNELSDWKTNGQSFLSGSTLGLELVQSLTNHTRELQTYIRTLAEQTKDEFKKVFAAFETINESLLTFEQKFQEIEHTLLRHEEDITRLQERVSSNDKRITNIEQNTSSTAQKRLFQVPQITGFVGRVDILQQIADTLNGPSVETNKLVLCGLGGIGKTSIAVEYIRKNYAEHYPGGVFWISGESGEAFETSIKCLAVAIGTLLLDPNTTQTNTFNWISRRQGRCLVVIDNVDEDKISNPVIRLVKEHNEIIGSDNHLVITTRRSIVKARDDLSCVKCIPVDVLSESESTAFFKRKLGDTNDSDDDIAALCVELEGLPLAIEQAATTIRQLNLTVSDYLREFKKRRIELLSKPLSSNVSHIDDFNKHSIRTTWTLNIENIRKKANMQGLTKAIDLLLPLVACLARDDITTDMFNSGDPRLTDKQVPDAFESDYRKREIVTLFTEYSILTENRDQTLRIHSLVQDVIRDYCKDLQYDFRYVGKCAISMLNMVIDLALKPEDIALLAKVEKQCAALQMHFKEHGIMSLGLFTLQYRCTTITFNILYHEWRILREQMLGDLNSGQDSVITKSLRLREQLLQDSGSVVGLVSINPTHRQDVKGIKGMLDEKQRLYQEEDGDIVMISLGLGEQLLQDIGKVGGLESISSTHRQDVKGIKGMLDGKQRLYQEDDGDIVREYATLGCHAVAGVRLPDSKRVELKSETNSETKAALKTKETPMKKPTEAGDTEIEIFVPGGKEKFTGKVVIPVKKYTDDKAKAEKPEPIEVDDDTDDIKTEDAKEIKEDDKTIVIDVEKEKDEENQKVEDKGDQGKEDIKAEETVTDLDTEIDDDKDMSDEIASKDDNNTDGCSKQVLHNPDDTGAVKPDSCGDTPNRSGDKVDDSKLDGPTATVESVAPTGDTAKEAKDNEDITAKEEDQTQVKYPYKTNPSC